MEMSSACTAPVHGDITEAAKQHPLYATYLRYRAAMTAQLVSCGTFEQWLAHREQAIEAERVCAHPLVKAWRKYLRQFFEENGTHVGALGIDAWVEATKP